MKISSHDIAFQSSHQFSNVQETATKITGIFFNGAKEEEAPDEDPVNISAQAKSKFRNRTYGSATSETEVRSVGADKNNPPGSPKPLISAMVSRAAGMDVTVTESSAVLTATDIGRPNLPGIQAIDPNGSITIAFTQTHMQETSEQTIVNSGGVIQTEDGREISFGMHLEMTREFSSQMSSSSEVALSKLIDPLVIQLDGGPPSLSDSTFSFDLNSDGKDETMRGLGKGSGFLALDINGDGIINDGTELFGTQSGNGFSDLAAYDEDGNGWIDENDSVFSKLSVWRPETDDESESSLGLLDANVGAIYLGYTSSEHSLTDDRGNTMAQLKSTGMFLKETGEAGHVFQMDMADISEPEPASEAETPLDQQADNNLVIQGLQPEEPRDFFSVIKEQLKNFRESMDAHQKKTSDAPVNVYDELMEKIKERLDELMEMLEGKKAARENQHQPYKPFRPEQAKRLNFMA